MNKKVQILNQIKALMNFSKVEDLKFLTIELEDKAISIEGDTLLVDSKVSLVDGDTVTLVEDNSLDGTYTHEGNTFTIANGIVTEVSPIEVVEVVEAATEEVIEPVTEEVTEVTAITEGSTESALEVVTDPQYGYKDEIQTLVNRVTVYEEQIAELRVVQENYSKALKVIEEYIGNTPADTTTNHKNFNTQSNTSSSIATGLEAIRNIRNK